MGSGTDRRYDLNDLNDLNDRPGITPRSGSGAMRGIVMMLAASLLVTANDALVKLALGAAGSAEDSRRVRSTVAPASMRCATLLTPNFVLAHSRALPGPPWVSPAPVWRLSSTCSRATLLSTPRKVPSKYDRLAWPRSRRRLPPGVLHPM